MGGRAVIFDRSLKMCARPRTTLDHRPGVRQKGPLLSRFLTEEYMTEATTTLGAHSGFSAAISSVELGLQFVVSDHPDDGELHYYLSIAGGSAELTRGELEKADVTVTNSYETAVGISKGDLDTQMAFMTGKLRIAGNMAKLMMNQGVITEFADALSSLDVTY